MSCQRTSGVIAAFENYIVSEYSDRAKGYAAVEFKYSHNCTNKYVKNRLLRCDIIKVNVLFVDKSMRKIYCDSITFENNALIKSKVKSLINISPKELENKFNCAKCDICKCIMNDYNDKKNSINEKISNLQKYINTNGIIPTEFKGECINIVDDSLSDIALRDSHSDIALRDNILPKIKTQYDM